MNLDIKGVPENELILGNSNPGRVSFSPGGVARNIAENLALLELPVTLFSAAGFDPFGDLLIKQTSASGADMSRILRTPGPTGIYLSLVDKAGNLAAALSHMEASESIKPEYLEKHRDLLKDSIFIAADANIPQESLEFLGNLASEEGIPYLIEPVSIQKGRKIRELSCPITFITPNRVEFEDLTGSTELSGASLSALPKVQNAVVTLGAEGAVLLSVKAPPLKVPAFPAVPVDPNGAGDAFTAGFIYALVTGKDRETALIYGAKAASAVISSPLSVNPDIKRFFSLTTGNTDSIV